jgi:Fe-S-cluster containining protein
MPPEYRSYPEENQKTDKEQGIFMADSEKQLFDKYDWLVMNSQIIKNHYQCPATCHAMCCKYSPIDFNIKEYYQILKNVDNESAHIIESKSALTLYGFSLPAGVCPLLKESKCRIYENRPEACRKFPFETMRSTNGFYLQLRICPLSIEIIHDFAQFLHSTNNNLAKSVDKLYKRHKNINNISVNVIILSDNVLEPFISWLDKIPTK